MHAATQVRYRKCQLSQKSAHAEHYAQTKTNTTLVLTLTDTGGRRCPDPNARIQNFIHYMAIVAICDSGLSPMLRAVPSLLQRCKRHCGSIRDSLLRI